jgi:hypothetical protein
MAGKNYGTMNNGYHYDEAKVSGYNIEIGNLYFSNVAYHSKKQLKLQLIHWGYKLKDIIETKN